MNKALTIVVTAVVTSLFWIGLVIMIHNMTTGESVPFNVRIQAPLTATVGDTFPIVVQVQNPHDSVMILDSIDLYDSLLNGFKVIAVEPSPLDQQKIYDFVSYDFSQSMEPGEVREWKFTVQAVRSGFWKGDIDVCDAEYKWTTVFTTLAVLGAADDPESESESEPEAETTDE